MKKSENYLFPTQSTQKVDGFLVNDGCIYKDGEHGKCVADFYTSVNGVYVFKNDMTEIIDISFYTMCAYGEIHIYRAKFKMSELKKTNFEQLDYRLTLKPYPRARSDIIYFIQAQAKLAPKRDMWYIDKLGDNILGDERIYCAGDVILPANGEHNYYYIDDNVRNQYHFDYDDKMNEHDAINAIVDFININPVKTSIIMAYSLTAVLRAPFKEAGISPNTTLMVVGDSQTHKTSAVTFSNNMYNRSSNMKSNTVRIDSSLAYAEQMLSALSETSFIYDDIYRDPINYRKIETSARAIIRENADDSPRNTLVGGKPINAQVTMTAEYIIKNVTDMGRVILLILHEPLDSHRLYQCQQNPLGISTFLKNFISWVYRNFNTVVEKIQDNLLLLRKWQTQNVSRYSRLDEYEMILNTSYSLFLDYGVEAEFYSCECADRELSIFKEYTKHWKDVQTMVLEKIASETNLYSLNYAKAIIDLIESGKIVIDENPNGSSNCYEGFAKFAYKQEKAPCLFIKSRYLCDTLNYYFKQQNTVTYYNRYLSSKCLLSHDSDCNYVKRFDERFLAISVELLKVEAQSEEYKIEKLFR